MNTFTTNVNESYGNVKYDAMYVRYDNVSLRKTNGTVEEERE